VQTKGELLKIDTLDLTLKTYAKVGAGGSIKFNIFEFGADYAKEDTQTIQMTFEPKIEGEIGPLGEADIETSLVNAIMEIKESMRAAALERPEFKLKNASVDLNFVVDAQGKISLVLKGQKEKQTTHALKLTFSRVDEEKQ